jgi:hypothetical protein
MTGFPQSALPNPATAPGPLAVTGATVAIGTCTIVPH